MQTIRITENLKEDTYKLTPPNGRAWELLDDVLKPLRFIVLYPQALPELQMPKAVVPQSKLNYYINTQKQ